jgi:hypothetical protein
MIRRTSSNLWALLLAKTNLIILIHRIPPNARARTCLLKGVCGLDFPHNHSIFAAKLRIFFQIIKENALFLHFFSKKFGHVKKKQYFCTRFLIEGANTPRKRAL